MYHKKRERWGKVQTLAFCRSYTLQVWYLTHLLNSISAFFWKSNEVAEAVADLTEVLMAKRIKGRQYSCGSPQLQ